MSFTQDSVKNCEEACSQEFFFSNDEVIFEEAYDACRKY